MKYKVLMIDDDEIELFLFVEFFKQKSYPFMIETANSYDEGLAYIKANTMDIDIILLDYALDGVNSGIDLLVNMKKDDISIPIIFVTGNGNEEIAVKAMKLGAYDYIVKNLNYLSLLPDRINLVIERVENEKELKILRKILPICSFCKKIRDENNTWLEVADYFDKYQNTLISHGICESCVNIHYSSI